MPQFLSKPTKRASYTINLVWKVCVGQPVQVFAEQCAETPSILDVCRGLDYRTWHLQHKVPGVEIFAIYPNRRSSRLRQIHLDANFFRVKATKSTKQDFGLRLGPEEARKFGSG